MQKRLNRFVNEPKSFTNIAAMIRFAGSVLSALLILSGGGVKAQEIPELVEARASLDSLMELVRGAEERVGALKGNQLHNDLKRLGYPESPFSGQLLDYSAMMIEYVAEHKQAAWVYYQILPDIRESKSGRTNDFREDSRVEGGTAVQEDYFLTFENIETGRRKYEGFGYDRGHLAASADFRWSADVLSESYFYTNITPQLPGFNREGWAELEGVLRTHVMRTGHPIWVATAGVLHDDLPVIERSVNQVSIPELYYKVVYDEEAGEGIGFLVPHEEHLRAPHVYAVSIDSVEAVTGINFFPNLPDAERIESQFNLQHWFPDLAGNTKRLDPTALPRNTFNTRQAAYQMNSNKAVRVCGHVVEVSKSKSNNVFIVLDQIYPEKIFQVMIGKDNLVNFDYAPHKMYSEGCVCVKGKVQALGSTPTMFIENQKAFGECPAQP
ncbi:MAG: DNA/RNA non-specific endonuclease [Cryomorphaceae bacterium]|nr:MAG: DNA/RNA non-specific endonuclease [Cryomorphaceae bacterium]